jgi:hypothetical protein
MMNTPDTPIAKARRELLLALDDAQVSSALLREFLEKAESTHPDLIERHTANELLDAIEAARSAWTLTYYSRQKICAENNFSRVRLAHLIDVREYFRQEGYKGFVPSVNDQHTSHMNHTSQTKRQEDARAAYQPSVNLRKFIDEGDLPAIRTALRLELNDNRNSSQDLRSAMVWTSERVSGLWAPYEEKAFSRAINTDQGDWSSEYYDNQTVGLRSNFAEKRFLHLIDVRDHLRERGVEGFAPIARSADSQRPIPLSQAGSSPSQARPAPNTTNHEFNPVFRMALLVGGAIAAAVIFLSLVK